MKMDRRIAVYGLALMTCFASHSALADGFNNGRLLNGNGNGNGNHLSNGNGNWNGNGRRLRNGNGRNGNGHFNGNGKNGNGNGHWNGNGNGPLRSNGNGNGPSSFYEPFDNELLEPALGFDIFGNGRTYGSPLRSNGFCHHYRRIVLTRSDLASIRGTNRAVRNRIQANDLMYLCRCEGFRSEFCFANGR